MRKKASKPWEQLAVLGSSTGLHLEPSSHFIAGWHVTSEQHMCDPKRSIALFHLCLHFSLTLPEVKNSPCPLFCRKLMFCRAAYGTPSVMNVAKTIKAIQSVSCFPSRDSCISVWHHPHVTSQQHACAYQAWSSVRAPPSWFQFSLCCTINLSQIQHICRCTNLTV